MNVVISTVSAECKICAYVCECVCARFICLPYSVVLRVYCVCVCVYLFWRRLVQTTTSQIIRYDDIGNGVEHKLNVVGVGGARHVTVDLLRGGLVLRLELGLNVGGRLAVLLATGVLREADGQRALADLLLEQILLVQKQND